jgi:hypothetical protein
MLCNSIFSAVLARFPPGITEGNPPLSARTALTIRNFADGFLFYPLTAHWFAIVMAKGSFKLCQVPPRGSPKVIPLFHSYLKYND